MFRVFLEEYADVENGQKKVRFPRCFVIYTIEVITKKNFLLAKSVPILAQQHCNNASYSIAVRCICCPFFSGMVSIVWIAILVQLNAVFNT